MAARAAQRIRDAARRRRSRRLLCDRRHDARAASAGRGRRIIFRDVSAGEVFGEHSALDGAPGSPTRKRCAKACLRRYRPKRFALSLRIRASVAERLLRRLSGSLRSSPTVCSSWARSRCSGQAELARLAREAGVAQNHARLEPAPTHSDVASRVGTSREQVSREFSRLAREGVLERAAKALVVRDVAALELISTKAHDPGRRNFRVGGDDGAR